MDVIFDVMQLKHLKLENITDLEFNFYTKTKYY